MPADHEGKGDDLRPDHIFKQMTFKDASRIANGHTLQSVDWRDEQLGDLLALMYGLTYCRVVNDRENILYAVIRAFMPDMDCAHKSMDALALKRLRVERSE